MSEHDQFDRPLTILVVEDSASARMMIAAVIERQGHQVVLAVDGIEGLAAFEAHKPDLVITDVNMPRMDGFELLQAIRSRTASRWVPVVFITAMDSEGPDASAQAVRALNLGADDLLRKPLEIEMLKAKLRAFRRALLLQDRTERQRLELETYRRHAEEEKAFASELIARLSRSQELQDPDVRIWQQAAEQFSGDVVAVTRTYSGRLHALLADGTGHGLTAALNVLPLIEPFYAMSAKGHSIHTIAIELNRKVYTHLPRECYVAAALVSYDPLEQRLETWNGGIPDLLLHEGIDRPMRHLCSQSPPLGVMKPAFFDPIIVSQTLDRESLLVLASDGLVEAMGQDDLAIGIANLEAFVRFHRDADNIERILRKRLAGAHPDDLTLLQIHCRVSDERSSPVDTLTEPPGSGVLAGSRMAEPLTRAAWRLELDFGPAELKRVDVVPMVRDVLQGLGIGEHDLDRASVVLTELFNNAVDHGILQLSTVSKNSADDMEQYFELRESRLANLESGSVKLLLRILPGEEQGLEMLVADSGPGFDLRQLEQPDNHRSRGGRGLRIVRELCERLEFRGTGNVAVAVLRTNKKTEHL
jgi:DNA-binding response OmpR family regulator/anti-sigma regulatory factor (Ser/Thr protein kinase)